MSVGNKTISAQLRLGDAELTAFSPEGIIAKIDQARKWAGLDRLLLYPSRNPLLNTRIIEHCRARGTEVYLWYRVLSDNDLLAHKEELVENAWGRRGYGESGIWDKIDSSDETYISGCPRVEKYNALLKARCRQMLEPYDGLFADCIAMPLPSQGLEAVYSCFCPDCLEKKPELGQWRQRAREFRENMFFATDADLERWPTMLDLLASFGLDEFFSYRKDVIGGLAADYAAIAADMGKRFAVDALAPALSEMGGHSYAALGATADWIKPRIYCRIFGPSSLPLEFYSLTMGTIAWGRRYSIPAILAFIERSVGVPMPRNVHALAQNYIPDRTAADELAKARALTPCPIHPGFEFSIHPDFDTAIDADGVRNYLAAADDAPGMVMTWNLLYIPETFMRLVGDHFSRKHA